LAADGTGAGGAGWDGGREGVVFVDVGGTLHETHLDKGAGDEAALLRGGNVALGSWHLLGDGCLCAGGEGTRSGGVNDGGVWSGDVSGLYQRLWD
jgi:hypothetical protein